MMTIKIPSLALALLCLGAASVAPADENRDLTVTVTIGEDVVNSMLAYYLQNTVDLEYKESSNPNVQYARVNVKAIYVDFEADTRPKDMKLPPGYPQPHMYAPTVPYFYVDLLVSWKVGPLNFTEYVTIARIIDPTSFTITNENWIGFKNQLFSEYSRLPAALRDTLERRYNRVFKTQMDSLRLPATQLPPDQIVDYAAVYRTPTYTIVATVARDVATLVITPRLRFAKLSGNSYLSSTKTEAGIGKAANYIVSLANVRFDMPAATLCNVKGQQSWNSVGSNLAKAAVRVNPTTNKHQGFVLATSARLQLDGYASGAGYTPCVYIRNNSGAYFRTTGNTKMSHTK